MARWQVPVVLGGVGSGIALGLAIDLGDGPEGLVVPALVALLTLTFAGIRPHIVVAQLRPHVAVAVASLGLNFLWAPAAAGVAGWLLLSDHPELRLGLVMLLVTPCTDWYLVFTASARGNVTLGTALLPVNLVLQLTLLPVFAVLLVGTSVDVGGGRLAASVALVVGIPLAVAVLARLAARSAGCTDQLDVLLHRAQPIGLVLLAVAITAIFASNARLVVNAPGAFSRLVLPLATFFLLTYLLSQAVARTLQVAREERVTLTMTSMARNSPIALAIAAAAFPDRPLVVLALVVGPLVELPVLGMVARLQSVDA